MLTFRPGDVVRRHRRAMTVERVHGEWTLCYWWSDDPPHCRRGHFRTAELQSWLRVWIWAPQPMVVC